MAMEEGFDPMDVGDDEGSSYGPRRFDSRVPVPWASSIRPPAPRTLRRTDTEEELRRIRMKQELYSLRKKLHEEEAEEAARSRCEVSEASKHNLGVSTRDPKAPGGFESTSTAQGATQRGAHFEELTEASISSTQQAEQAHLTPPSESMH